VHRSTLTAIVFLAACGGAAPQSRPSVPAATPSFPAASTPTASDARARAVAARVMDSLGGKEAWDRTRYLRFGFGGVRDGKWSGRTHHWDKWTGRYRVEGQTRDGKPFLTLMNLNTKEGVAWLEGKKLEGDDLKKALERGYGMWVNDTYWLLMPYKMKDPGVNLDYAGSEQIDGKTYDKLHLTFGKVGLTPGDQYWAYINHDTHLMDRWAYLLQDQPREAAPTVWLWQGWQKYGKIMLAPARIQVGGDGKLPLSDIAVFETLPDSVFTSADPVAAPAAQPAKK
jgi:hypothetical protein